MAFELMELTLRGDIHSVSASAARGILMGFGINTYFRAVDAALDIAAEVSRKN